MSTGAENASRTLDISATVGRRNDAWINFIHGSAPSGKCFLSDHEIKKQRSFANLDLFGSVTGTVLMPKGIAICLGD
jgi:hypothetical protein